MPQRGRSKKAAARQTQLGQRKKRQARAPQPEFPLDTPQLAPAPVADLGGEVSSTPEPARPSPVIPRSAPARGQVSRASVYNYIGPEVKRIGILSTVILTVLIVLTVVLR